MTFKPTLRQDGRKHVTLRVRHDPDRDTVAAIIALEFYEDGKDVSRTAVEEAVRGYFTAHGTDAYLGVGDELGYSDDADAALEWAEGQVTRLWPGWTS